MPWRIRQPISDARISRDPLMSLTHIWITAPILPSGVSEGESHDSIPPSDLLNTVDGRAVDKYAARLSLFLSFAVTMNLVNTPLKASQYVSSTGILLILRFI